MPLGGLREDLTYRVALLPPGDRAPVLRRPAWMEAPLTLTGRVLQEVGLELPVLPPDQYLLIEATAV
jgi:alpha-galactosidase